MLLGKTGSSWYDQFSIEAWNNGNVSGVLLIGSAGGDGAFATNDTNWHHIAYTYDGSQTGNSNRLHGYLDGVQQTLSFGGTIPATTTSDTGAFRLGLVEGLYSNGLIDEVRIYNRVLSLSEIQADRDTPINGTSPPPPPPPPPSGLVASYSLNEGSGTIAHNGVSSSYDGTFSGTPTWVTGRYGNALAFNGSDYVDMGNIPGMLGLTSFTFEAWIKRTAANDYVLLGKTGSGWYDQTSIEVWNNGNVSGVFLIGAAGGDGAFATNDTSWHHIAYVFDGSQTGNANRLRGYLDGVQQTLSFGGTIPATTTSDTGAFRLGLVEGLYSNGSIDEVRIYNRALTTTEIQTDRDTPLP